MRRPPHRIFLTVLKNNTQAMTFYTSMKYTIDEGSPSKDGEDVGHEIMSKSLTPVRRITVDAPASAADAPPA